MLMNSDFTEAIASALEKQKYSPITSNFFSEFISVGCLSE